MPWHVVKSVSKCSASKPWAVIKNQDGSVAGCHETKADALKQLAALYANESSESAMALPISTMLIRDVPFRLSQDSAEPEGDGRTFEGYAAVWDSPTEIDSWEGTFTESIRKGAFRKTLKERMPVLQFDHGRHPVVGSIPIGAIREVYEDDQGVYTLARLSDNWMVKPVRDAIAEGSITGMSFRFEVIRDRWTDAAGKEIKDHVELMDLLWNSGDRGPIQRELIELRVPELGPVVFPAYTETSVSVRAAEAASKIIADPDQLRAVRASLAGLDVKIEWPDVPAHEVATALLFPMTTTRAHLPPTTFARPGIEASEIAEDDADEAPSDPETRSDDAPPEGHPSPEEESTTDAPLVSEHPLATRTTPEIDFAAEERRLARIRVAESRRARMKDTLGRAERYHDA